VFVGRGVGVAVGGKGVGVAVGCRGVGVAVGCRGVGVAVGDRGVGVAVGDRGVGVAVGDRGVGVANREGSDAHAAESIRPNTRIPIVPGFAVIISSLREFVKSKDTDRLIPGRFPERRSACSSIGAPVRTGVLDPHRTVIAWLNSDEQQGGIDPVRPSR
jgi:hypothetical protein